MCNVCSVIAQSLHEILKCTHDSITLGSHITSNNAVQCLMPDCQYLGLNLIRTKSVMYAIKLSECLVKSYRRCMCAVHPVFHVMNVTYGLQSLGESTWIFV